VLPAYSQPSNFGAPLAGYIYSRDSRTVRPVIGSPGASYMAPAVLSDVDSASIAPGGRWGLITRAGSSLFVRGLSYSQPVELPADGVIQPVDRIVWNRDGSFALLYSSTTGQLQRVSLAGDHLSADSPVDVSSWSRISALAIDPAGRQIVFGVPGSGLYLFLAGQSPALLSPMANPVAASFDETGQNLYAADLDQQQIVSFASGSGPLPFVSLVQADGTVLNPVGLGVSNGGRYLLLADSATRAVLVYNTTSQSLANTIPLDFPPTRFEALSSGPSFLLNGDNSSEWFLVLDSRQTPRVYFVPASKEQL